MSFCSIAVIGAACMDATVEDTDTNIWEQEATETYSYDGTIYDFLDQEDNEFDVTFHSMLTLLNYDDDSFHHFSELKSRLSDVSEESTLLAIPDACFDAAFKSVNIYRERNNLTTEGALTLEKLFIPRFVQRENPESTEKNPLPPITVTFDYKEDLDSILCRYVLPGICDTHILEAAGGDSTINTIRYNYRMRLSYKRMPASGFVGAGVKDLTYYDINNTLQMDKWDMSKVKWMDIHTLNGVIHIMNPGHEFSFEEFTHRFKNYGYEK